MIAIDGNNLAWRVYHTMGNLSHDGLPTGVQYGVLTQVFHFIEKFGTPNVVFTWDSRKSHRKRLFAGYKDRGPKNDDGEEHARKQSVASAISDLRNHVLPQIGFKNNFLRPGVEADDLLAQLCAQFRLSASQSLIIVSGDNDLYQLLAPNSQLYNPAKRKLSDVGSFCAEFGMTPGQWWKVKMIAGCASDTVPGVPGVGEKTAIKYLRGDLGKHTKAFQTIESHLADDTWCEFQETLVRLPHPKTPSLSTQRNAFDMGALWNVCEELGFESLMKPDQWEKIEKVLIGGRDNE